ncbi:hypothetical protein MKEN_00628300 [Mycena kentingensis (nom. inval.)]|nr:hypothetical protein MKEN_00628300 [Mycena kentingensis (nom. inval.)]
MPPKKKAKRNISGLRNQPPRQESSDTPATVLEADSTAELSAPTVHLATCTPPMASDIEVADQLEILFNSHETKRRVDGAVSTTTRRVSEQSEGDHEQPEVAQQRPLVRVHTSFPPTTDDADPDWLPARELRKRARAAAERKPRGPYAKGPDVMSKSESTRRRYAQSWRTQSSLLDAGFSKTAAGTHTHPAPISVHGSDSDSEGSNCQVGVSASTSSSIH